MGRRGFETGEAFEGRSASGGNPLQSETEQSATDSTIAAVSHAAD